MTVRRGGSGRQRPGHPSFPRRCGGHSGSISGAAGRCMTVTWRKGADGSRCRGVWMPSTLRWGSSWPWQWVFPARRSYRDSESGRVRRHHLHVRHPDGAGALGAPGCVDHDDLHPCPEPGRPGVRSPADRPGSGLASARASRVRGLRDALHHVTDLTLAAGALVQR